MTLITCEICPGEGKHRCSKCHTTRYCDAAHQKQDWTHHRWICASLAFIASRRIDNVPEAVDYLGREISGLYRAPDGKKALDDILQALFWLPRNRLEAEHPGEDVAKYADEITPLWGKVNVIMEKVMAAGPRRFSNAHPPSSMNKHDDNISFHKEDLGEVEWMLASREHGMNVSEQ